MDRLRPVLRGATGGSARGTGACSAADCHLALAVHDELGVQFEVADDLERLAGVAANTGSETAVRLLGAAEVLREAIGAPMFPVDQPAYDRAVTMTRVRLGIELFETAWAAGRRLSEAAAVAEALAFAGAFPSRASAEPSPFTLRAEAFGLSQRELQVLHLLAQRQTDKEIADALFLSPRTVNSHVARLFAKLGTNNRRAAAALARREVLSNQRPTASRRRPERVAPSGRLGNRRKSDPALFNNAPVVERLPVFPLTHCAEGLAGDEGTILNRESDRSRH